MKAKEKIIRSAFVLLIMSALLCNLSYPISISNPLLCDMFKKDNIPNDYYPIVGVATDNVDANGNPINGHLSQLTPNIKDGNYTYVIACNTKNYVEIEGKVLEKYQTCEDFGYAYVINMSDKENAHVKSPYSTLPDKYYNELCINILAFLVGGSGLIYCDVKDGDCNSDEGCMFKFIGTGSGGSAIDSNAHVYHCNTSIFTSPSQYKSVCCKLLVNPEGEVIIDIKSSIISQNETYLQLGMYSQFLVSLYNPSSKPQSVTLELGTTNDENGKIFKNFIWFSGKGAASKRETITLKPYERDYVIVNIFGGKVGKYKLYILKDKDGEKIKLYEINVTVLPSSTIGISEESPEFGQVFMLAILICASMLLYRKL